MQTIVNAMREIIGIPEFYINGAWDYGLMVEYVGALLLVLLVVSSVFKLLINWSK